jgi:hypothetical protein
MGPTGEGELFFSGVPLNCPSQQVNGERYYTNPIEIPFLVKCQWSTVKWSTVNSQHLCRERSAEYCKNFHVRGLTFPQSMRTLYSGLLAARDSARAAFFSPGRATDR